MLILYRFSLFSYRLLIHLAAFFGNTKAQQWVEGRVNWEGQLGVVPSDKRVVWFHCASLGEFEQARPIIEAIKRKQENIFLVLTFFSPSGYEIRKNYPLADRVLYLPIDSPRNARVFVDVFRPKEVYFTKYEYWFFYFRAVRAKEIPLYVVSAIFRPGQVFFKWYGGLHRKMLSCVSHFFVQDETSVQLLSGLGFSNVTLSGDTRFDRVNALLSDKKEMPAIAQFKGDAKLLVSGSTWPKDEKILADWLKIASPNWKLVLAPHEIDTTHLRYIEETFGSVCFYSTLDQLCDSQVLVIDSIGFLSSVYRYADVAYVGGGFDKGVHNTLEPAVYEIPVMVGPKHSKFKEIMDMIAKGAAFPLSQLTDLQEIMEKMSDSSFRLAAGKVAGHYVQQNTGATERILNSLECLN